MLGFSFFRIKIHIQFGLSADLAKTIQLHSCLTKFYINPMITSSTMQEEKKIASVHNGKR